MAIKLVLLSGVFCIAAACAASAGLAWKSKSDSESKRLELAETASRLNLENSRLLQQIAAQRRSLALLRNECSIRAVAGATETVQHQEVPGNAAAPAAPAETMVELRQIDGRVEVAPGGPMSPISN